MNKGAQFLHNHPMTEQRLGLDDKHVIVDRDAWEHARAKLNNLSLPPAEGAEEKCSNCKGEGYTNFYDQGEPDLDSKCHACNGTGRVYNKPTAEGAEEILKILKKYEGIECYYQYDVATEEDALKNRATLNNIADELASLINQFATLHAQKIADKMVEDMRQKLFSMRATKKTMDMLSEADRLITYGYHDCINEMLMWTKSREK